MDCINFSGVARITGLVLLALTAGIRSGSCQQQRGVSQAPAVRSPVTQSAADAEKQAANLGVVTIMGGDSKTGATRVVEELRIAIEGEDGGEGTVRVVPILGRSGASNVLDLRYLHGIDIAVVEQDQLEYLRRKEPTRYGDINKKIQYITKLFPTEFHVVAGNSIQNANQLSGKKINCSQKLSSTAVACETIFKNLGIDVEITHYTSVVGMQKLKKGELDAYAQIGAAPLPPIAALKRSDNLHLVPLDKYSLAPDVFAKIRTIYLPGRFSHDQYPELISEGDIVSTVGNSLILATYAYPKNSGQYERVAKFVASLFSRMDVLRKDPFHPRWRDVNVAAVAPGWDRFQPAQQWLTAHQGAAVDTDGSRAELEGRFEEFLKDYLKTHGMSPGSLSAADRSALFVQFKRWWESDNNRSVGNVK